VKFGRKIGAITKRVIESLMNYSWPGNVRELENVIERAVIVTKGNKLDIGNSLPEMQESPKSKGLATLSENERTHILKILELTNWKVSGTNGAARLLGMKRTTLEARIKKLGIQRL